MRDRFVLLTAPLSIIAGCAATLLYLSAPASKHVPDGFTSLPLTQISYQMPGEFLRDGKHVPNIFRVISTGPLQIARDLVSAGDFKRCIADGGCPKIRDVGDRDDYPAINVSWRDASAYAAWLSAKTGDKYRLPTDEEWTFAAAERAGGDLPGIESSDASERRLARYEQEFGGEAIDTVARLLGSFGRNSHGLSDIGGNVWEWTDSRYVRYNLERASSNVINCGVRVVAGRHRAYVTDFIRDAKGGGCTAGNPRPISDSGSCESANPRARRAACGWGTAPHRSLASSDMCRLTLAR